MAGVNHIVVLGNLGADPEIRSMPNGDLVATLSVATSRSWKDKATGELKELVEWHRIVLYRQLAELAKNYLHKGSKAYIDGYLRTQRWTDTNQIERWTTQIVGENLQLLDPKTTVTDTQGKNKSQNTGQTELPPSFDDIPF